MKKLYGFELCSEQLLSRMSDRLALDLEVFEKADWLGFLGDTPIERLFSMALRKSIDIFGDTLFFNGLINCRSGDIERIKSIEASKRSIIIESQAQLDGWRVDFLITAYAVWNIDPDGGVKGWQQLIVECDGHDFHERTKEQAAKDRERDRRFQLTGIDVFRFTGSELWKDPLGCSDQVIEWANRRA